MQSLNKNGVSITQTPGEEKFVKCHLGAFRGHNGEVKYAALSNALYCMQLNKLQYSDKPIDQKFAQYVDCLLYTSKTGDDFNVEDDNESYMLFIPFTNIFNNSIINPNQLYKVKAVSYTHLISLTVYHTLELEQQIFSFGPDVDVLSPTWFRKEFGRKINYCMKKYLSMQNLCIAEGEFCSSIQNNGR